MNARIVNTVGQIGQTSQITVVNGDWRNIPAGTSATAALKAHIADYKRFGPSNKFTQQ